MSDVAGSVERFECGVEQCHRRWEVTVDCFDAGHVLADAGLKEQQPVRDLCQRLDGMPRFAGCPGWSVARWVGALSRDLLTGPGLRVTGQGRVGVHG